MSLAKLFDGSFRQSQAFGNRLIIRGVDIYGQYGLKGHNGIDYALPVKTPLLATVEGKAEVVNQGKAGYGLQVRILKTRTDGITEVIYGHLTSNTVQTGQMVKVGQLIGFSGGNPDSPNSGTSTGAHLHFGLRFRDLSGNVLDQKNGYLGWVDPQKYFA